MIYPRSDEYRAAFQHIQNTLSDEILRNGTVRRNSLGPRIFSGNFAYAFEITTEFRAKYAVRCFRYESPDRKERYKAISAFLKKLKSPYFLDFEYQDEGILVDGVKYPVVKMAWADGDLLGEFITDNYNKRVKMKNLLHSLRRLARFIEQNHFAHGDIQGGNIIVQNNGKVLRLIDYDGMYVSDIDSFGNAECGVPNFQHPKRGDAWNRKLDRFAFIALYVAIYALLERHHLWEETNSDVESIIFSEEDYLNPSSSHTFAKLRSYRSLERIAGGFAKVCEGSFRNIPSLENFIKENTAAMKTSILVPLASAVILGVGGFLYYQNPQTSSAPTLISNATQERENRITAARQYDSLIESLKQSYAQNPDDKNKKLDLIMAYAKSGFDDEALSNLAMPLFHAKIKDYRLYFALGVFYWRSGNIPEAATMMNILKYHLPQDQSERRLVLLFDEIVAVQQKIYADSYNEATFSSDFKREFAAAMVLIESYQLYHLMSGMYGEGFIGFSLEFPFDTKEPFDRWFDNYAAQNAARGLKTLQSLQQRFSKSNLLLYYKILSVSDLFIDEKRCLSSKNRRADTQKLFGKSDFINARALLQDAKKLANSPFSKALVYYALGQAYWANDMKEEAKNAFLHAKEHDYGNRISDKISARLKEVAENTKCRESAK